MLKFIGQRKVTREQIKELKELGFYLEYCDTGKTLVDVDVFSCECEDDETI
jgi:hypothetical protein